MTSPTPSEQVNAIAQPQKVDCQFWAARGGMKHGNCCAPRTVGTNSTTVGYQTICTDPFHCPCKIMMDNSDQIETVAQPTITRIEVIDEKGRSYVNQDDNNEVTYQVQDEGRTLKVFVKTKEPEFAKRTLEEWFVYNGIPKEAAKRTAELVGKWIPCAEEVLGRGNHSKSFNDGYDMASDDIKDNLHRQAQ